MNLRSAFAGLCGFLAALRRKPRFNVTIVGTLDEAAKRRLVQMIREIEEGGG